jgi:poly-beta-1,6 N-acetyl-D-glucosamine synthase
MSASTQIFQVDKPTRWKRVKWTFRLLLFILIFITTVVILAVIYEKNPVAGQNERSKFYKASLDPSNKFTLSTAENKKFKGFKDFLEKKQKEDSLKKINSSHSIPLIRSAFYTPWSSASLPSLKKNIDKLNTIYPEWFFIDTLTYSLQTRIDSAGLAVMKEGNLSIQPILNNFRTNNAAGTRGDFDPLLAHVILNNAVKRKKIIRQIVDTLSYYNLQGINIDFEELNEPNNETLALFQKELYEALHPKNKILSIDVSPGNEDYDYKTLSLYNDYVVLMAYDQYSDATGAGPISAQQWIEKQLDFMDGKVNASKIILGIAAYARDWINEEDENGKRVTRVDDITYNNAIDKAKLSGAIIQFDNNTYNLHYSYIEKEADSSSETKHEVWFTDAATSFNILRFSDEYRTAGTAMWHIGGEDPRIWNYYGRDLSNAALVTNPFDFSTLAIIPIDLNTKPTSTGEGELINFLFEPQQGKINIEVDSAEMLIAEQQYVQLPSGYVYEKFAEDTTKGPGHKIILTFDDGPDEKYTPQILNILEKENVPATFFVVGINAESNIPLLQRIYRDGYEIGNHTFTHNNVAKMSSDRAALEMKTTRALIECITGRSTILFRAPFNADSEPQTYEEIEPIARSRKDNYITVGESIDPNDWDEKMNADSIVNRTIRFSEQNNASIILLHDAGGKTRQPTVDALPRIIQYFKQKQYKFTTVADLMGKTKDDVMPKVPLDWKNRMNWIAAETYYWAHLIVFALFIVGIFLSVGRMALMAVLASLQRKKELQKNTAVNMLSTFPAVAVIVPAYNEEVNAVRTVNSLLQQDYSNLQIIFVDDGSKDNTYNKVKETFANNNKVHVYTKPNGGKASALNYGITLAATDYVVCIDADTQLKNDAITELMKKFDKEGKVGAVAGNVKVGNEINMITRWQSIEYITSQNFDRRAFDLLNCITVVPGAIGAFKKEAIIKAGGFTTDTLAEDCDLTMRMHKSGYQISNCTAAISYTEAPETMKQFLKQRFRWSFGVMQCFWKHRYALFNPRYKNFGLVAMPNILIFQMILPFLAPLADIILLISLLAAGMGIIQSSISNIILYYFIFTLVDVAGAALAFAFEKEKFHKLIWLLPQRLIYRQLMYYILLKSFSKALKGELQGWGALKRTGNVKKIAAE